MKTPYEDMAPLFEAHAQDSAYNAHYDRPAVLALAGDVAGKRVLDAGCGPGLYAEELVARGADVVAVDASAAMVQLARKRLGSGAHVLQADLGEPLPFADSEFDLVVCPLVIHYVDDRTAAFRELWRVLRSGGHLVLSTQHPMIDWMRKGGSYFDVKVEVDDWTIDDTTFDVHFWREPLTDLCDAACNAGFLIARLVEPRPAESMRERYPEDFERLENHPEFLMLRLLKP